MSRLLNTGISSLTANQAALQTIGHNIANVNTAGYSRQTVALQTVTAQNLGSGFIGNGVSVATITRNYNALLNKQSNAATAASTADSVRYQSLNQMQDVFSGGDSSLGAAINAMMNAFADVQSAPADSTARNVVLTRMTELASRFRAASDMLEEQDYTTKQQLHNNVTVVNSLASQVATLNGQISRALATGHTPNDLLDARDQIIREINQFVQTSQIDADDGSISLFIGGSQPLVLGTTSGKLSLDITEEYPGSGKLSLYFSQPGGDKVQITAAMAGGGEMAGLLKFNNEDLVEGRNLLGRLALSIGTELNNQNKLGLTLGGNFGTDLFKLTSVTYGSSNIAGFSQSQDPADAAKTATTTVVDASKLVASEYKVVFGSNHPADTKLVRLSDGVSRNINAADMQWNAATQTFTADGLQFKLPTDAGFAPSANQSILFQPYVAVASTIESLVHNPNDLAATSAITATIASTNSGTLQLSALETVSVAGGQIPGTQQRISLTFTAQGAFNYKLEQYNSTATPPAWEDVPPPNDVAGTGTYASGEAFTVNGWRMTLTGTPAVGDTVTVGNTMDLGEGRKLNAGNATAFLALRDKPLYDDGTTLSDGFSAAMAVIGTRTQSAKYAAELSASVATNLEADRNAFSGVNLDEEAARLLQFQQSYQASAKVIQIAQSLFDSVLNAVN